VRSQDREEEQCCTVEGRNADYGDRAVWTGRHVLHHEREVCTTEEDYILDFPESDDEDEEEKNVLDAEGELLPAVELAAQALAREAAATARREAKRRAKEKLILTLREGTYEGRRKAMDIQKSNERTVWPLMWKHISLASQSRVREEED
jgi:hypothetical protein